MTFYTLYAGVVYLFILSTLFLLYAIKGWFGHVVLGYLALGCLFVGGVVYPWVHRVRWSALEYDIWQVSAFAWGVGGVWACRQTFEIGAPLGQVWIRPFAIPQMANFGECFFQIPTHFRWLVIGLLVLTGLCMLVHADVVRARTHNQCPHLLLPTAMLGFVWFLGGWFVLTHASMYHESLQSVVVQPMDAGSLVTVGHWLHRVLVGASYWRNDAFVHWGWLVLGVGVVFTVFAAHHFAPLFCTFVHPTGGGLCWNCFFYDLQPLPVGAVPPTPPWADPT